MRFGFIITALPQQQQTNTLRGRSIAGLKMQTKLIGAYRQLEISLIRVNGANLIEGLRIAATQLQRMNVLEHGLVSIPVGQRPVAIGNRLFHRDIMLTRLVGELHFATV